MNIISSFLSMQMREVKDENLIFILKNAISRIQSMALVHQKLYSSKNLTDINFSEYVKNLVEPMISNYNVSKSKIDINYDLEETYMDIDTTIYLGIVINEIVTNSFKYAFANDKNGVINIILKIKNDDQISLTISDNGKGFDYNDPQNPKDSFGKLLISELIKRQLNGLVDIKNDNGVSYAITFPKKKN